MTAAESYRVRAAELTARAVAETDRAQRAELHALAQSYLRLAEQAERNSRTDIVYETPSQPAAAQQQQIQPKKDET